MKLSTIEQITTDLRFQTLKYNQEKTNVFTVVGQTHTEHWHSAFMCWLLNPSSSLQLGHYPVARLLNSYLIKNKETNVTLQDIYRWDLNKLRFQTEKTFTTRNGGKRSIDVYGESDELIIVIENKVKSIENYNKTDVGQTKDYFDYAEDNKKTGQETFYFFITPDPKQNAYHDAYTQLTYQEMYDYIILKCIQHPQINTESKFLLEQYSNNLREPVKNSPMALVNIDLCKDLYETYQDALDEIFTDVEQCADLKNSDKLSCVFYGRYRSVFDEIYLSIDEKYGITPKSLITRSMMTFTDLYNAGKVTHGMEFFMEHAGVLYRAVIQYIGKRKACYLLLLDENGNPYMRDGKRIGYYTSPSQAGIDAINFYRKMHNIEDRVVTLRGTTYWKTSDGQTIKELIDSI